MNSQVILSIAKTHLFSRLKQSVIAALGVTFGIGMFIAMVGFMTGVNKFLEDLMLENTAHVHIYNDISAKRKPILDKEKDPLNHFNVVLGVKPKDVKRNIKDGPEILKMIMKDPHVAGASPLLVAQVFYNSGSTPLNGSISGVDIVEYDKLFGLKAKMEIGEITDLLTLNNGIIIGKGLAENLNVGLHDQVNITTFNGVQIRLIVVGIFSTGIAAVDNVSSFAILSTVQKIMEKNKDYFTDINVKLTNIDDSKKMAKLWGEQFDYRAEDWMEANSELLVSFTLRNAITFAVSFSLLIVAGFGIYNILTMMIYEKMNDIAILKATGFTGNDIMKIFITEALIIGIVGGLSGLLLGFLMAIGISNVPLHSSQIKALTHMPVNFDIVYYVFGLLFALITTFLAGLFPARRASKVDPIEIIRGK